VRAAGVEPPPRGSTLHDADGAVVGDVRTAVRSPMLGGIALAMVRREVAPGAPLVARWRDDTLAPDDPAGQLERRVDIAALPFAIQ
jgi:hypothetical protein